MADYLDWQGAPWGAFIRAQLALTQALRSGTVDEVLEHRAKAEQLERAHGKAWMHGVDALVTHCKFSRGFVEDIIVDAKQYLHGAEEIFNRAPIRHLRLNEVGELLGAVLQDQHLAQIVSLSIGNLSGKQPIGDAGLAAIAETSKLRGLKVLAVPWQSIGMHGLEALCASKALPTLCHVNLRGNLFDDPVESYGADWETGQVVRDSAYLPPLGRELEAKYGDLPWLHGPSRLRNFPPEIEEL
jgi:hypothetical protein